MTHNTFSLEKLLKAHFQLKAFRTGQREIIEAVLKDQDVLGVLPTGSGKSLCYQFPAKIRPGLTIVVSPLISLMVDQVRELKAQNFKRVAALNSSLTYDEREAILKHLSSYKLIYASPEILQQEKVKGRLKEVPIRLFVIDEAHCISQWGHEFRPDYMRLKDLLAEFGHPPLLALSATATEEVQQDIVYHLQRPQMKRFIYPMDRKNIVLNIEKVSDHQEKLSRIHEVLKDHHIPTLIYFSSRQVAEDVSRQLSQLLPNHRISYYHGGLTSYERLYIQQQFMNDQLDVICCTSAFGMGINKSNIRLIIHYHIPTQLESFIQEIGRAGRDGKKSVSLLLYGEYDQLLPERLIEQELPTEEQVRFIFYKLYQLFKKGHTIPTKKEEIEQLFQCSETQWRFLFYQLEKAKIISKQKINYDAKRWFYVMKEILQYRATRLTVKEKKLQQMVEWIQSKHCLRESLYKPFQDGFTRSKEDCCSKCGFKIDQWQPQPTIKSNDLHKSWQEQLKKLLYVGEYDEE